MTKTEMRAAFLDRRRAMAGDVVAGASAAVAERVCRLPAIEGADAVLSYVASKDHEVETRGILEWAWGRGTRVLVPVCLPERAMGWCVLQEYSALARTGFGVLEPRVVARALVEAPVDGPVLVPGIVFDRQGYRIGYGAGYFDRFLDGHRGVKVGLAYSWQVVDAVPRESHDVAMDVVVTEVGVEECL